MVRLGAVRGAGLVSRDRVVDVVGSLLVIFSGLRIFRITFKISGRSGFSSGSPPEIFTFFGQKRASLSCEQAYSACSTERSLSGIVITPTIRWQCSQMKLQS
jgi:hypothetical protein